MLPLSLDLSRLRLALVGNGEAAVKRLGRLEAAGARMLAVYAEAPTPALAAAAGPRLARRRPGARDLAAAQLVFIADAPDAASLVRTARAAGAIVHVEDAPALSDAQAPAVLHRGGLTLAVSTGGASPALARQVRDFLGTLFGPEWRGRIDELSRQRRSWRRAGLAPDAVAHRTGEWLNRRGWLAQPITRH